MGWVLGLGFVVALVLLFLKFRIKIDKYAKPVEIVRKRERYSSTLLEERVGRICVSSKRREIYRCKVLEKMYACLLFLLVCGGGAMLST